jgi:hypothetical protein
MHGHGTNYEALVSKWWLVNMDTQKITLEKENNDQETPRAARSNGQSGSR